VNYSNIGSTNGELTVYVINSGLSNNVTLTRLYIWNSANQFIGTYNILQLYGTSSGTPISSNSLNMGNEGYFNVTTPTLTSGYYSIRVVTGRGRNFDYSFSF
jgi:hypothetical protein